jgi:hypothetical protein
LLSYLFLTSRSFLSFYLSLFFFYFFTIICLFLPQCLPYKFATNALTPRHFQRDRGTCWTFSTVGNLEASYIKNGVEKGFLKQNEYVQFSEQAYGITLMEECGKHPDVCTEVVGTETTEGGDVYWLYSLGAVYTKILPESVCPYINDPGFENEHDCPDYDKAVASNPIRFNIKNMLSGFSIDQTKKLMAQQQNAMTWGTLMNNVYYYYPCAETDWADKAGCTEEKRVRCPLDKNYNSEFCAVYVASMYNQDGEFFYEGNLITEGGHEMVAVGYNDNFVTKMGTKGGFIIKNRSVCLSTTL